MKTQYKVVPFISSITDGQSADIAAKQLQHTINSVCAEGWEFIEVANVNIEVKPGCLAAIFGTKSTVIVYNQIIFKKDIEAPSYKPNLNIPAGAGPRPGESEAQWAKRIEKEEADKFSKK